MGDSDVAALIGAQQTGDNVRSVLAAFEISKYKIQPFRKRTKLKSLSTNLKKLAQWSIDNLSLIHQSRQRYDDDRTSKHDFARQHISNGKALHCAGNRVLFPSAFVDSFQKTDRENTARI